MSNYSIIDGGPLLIISEGKFMNKNPLGVALIPDQVGIDYLCELNQAINKRYPSEFILRNQGKLIPHVSLFQGQYSREVILALEREMLSLKNLIHLPIVVRVVGMSVWATKIFFLDLDKDDQLLKLHRHIFEKFNSLRDVSSGSADPQVFVDITDQERESYQKYGYPFALKAFRPHFTLGRSELMDGKEKTFVGELSKKLSPPAYFNFNELVLFEVGKFGRLESVRWPLNCRV